MFSTTYLIAGLTSYLFIGLRAFQQLNVVHGNKLLVVPVSVLMATCEVLLVGTMVSAGLGPIVLWLGIGAGFGSLTAMFMHKRFAQ